MEQFDGYLDLTLSGQGQVAFVIGEAGSGKTTLLQEFSRRAQDVHTNLVVANGNCNTHTGVGDPYLPFREALDLLTGDIESRWIAGAMTREQAQRLWKILPYTVESLLQEGPDLIGAFISASALVERAMASTHGRVDWLTSLSNRVDRKMRSQIDPSLQQGDLLDQFTRVLQTLSCQFPLVIMLDDLQWAEIGSISLLFHLGRCLEGRRILVIGAFRPEEIALGRDGGRHPLEPVVNELRREHGDITINLNQTENRGFIDALLDSEPNLLGRAFREMLYQQTQGNPLFAVELLRGMQERGDLVQDAEGQWTEGPELDCNALPVRIEAVIGERISRLDLPLQAALRVANVEGEIFTAEVVAKLCASDERKMVRRLSNELDRQHLLIRAQSIDRLGTRRVSRYRFRHILVQKYLYDNMDEVERAYLHEDVGNILEDMHRDRVNEIAMQLARHFQEAGIVEKAVHYLHLSGTKALRLSAYQEAITHLTKRLELLKILPVSPQRAEQELSLQLTLGVTLVEPKGFGPEVIQAFNRARELCQKLEKTSQLCRVMGELSSFQKAIDIARQQEARSWELCAANSLARLWQDQVRTDEAR